MPQSCRSGLVVAALIMMVPVLAQAAAWDEALAAQARSEFLRAVKLYNAQLYAEAAEAFRSAYLTDPAPKLLFSIAQAQRLAGDCAQAIDSYRSFLRTDPEPSAAALARENMASCETPPTPPLAPQPARDDSAAQAIAAPVPPPANRGVLTGILLGTAGASAVGAVVFAIMEHHSISERNASAAYDAFKHDQSRANTQGALALSLGGVALGCAGTALWRLWQSD